MFIDKIGLELEGGWPGKAGVRPFKEEQIIVDRSIDGHTMPHDKRMASTHVGEIVSKPMALDAWEPWVRKYWPKEANNTCGYHIHISLKKPLYYMLLTRKQFLWNLLAAIEAEGKRQNLPETHYLWARINGGNPFCVANFDASQQIAVTQKRIGMRTRYGMLNFAHGLHKTVEWRGYPTFDNVEHAVIFTDLFLQVVNSYLTDASKKDWSRRLSISISDGTLQIERR